MDDYGYENYIEIPISKQLLIIDLTSIPFNEIQNKILTIIIKGNIEKLDYLGCHQNEPNIDIAPLELIHTKYNYGEETSKLFQKYQNVMTVLKQDFNIELHPEAKGFYIETINTKEVNTLIVIEKETLNLKICSYDKIDDVYLTGTNHINGKIEGKGNLTKYDNHREIKISGTIHNNKIMCIDECLKKENWSIYSKLFNSLTFNENCSIKNIIHHHELFYCNTVRIWRCNYCLNEFDNFEPSFRCKKCPVSHYYLCNKCSFNKFESYNDFIDKIKRTGKKITTFNRNIISIKSGFHKHNLIRNKEYYHNYLCDLCMKDLKEHRSFRCETCNFDLCWDCMKNSINDENTRNLLLLNEEIEEIILGFEEYEFNALSKVFFAFKRIMNLDIPSFYIKTKRNKEFVLEYGKFNIKEKEVIYNDKSYKVFYPNYIKTTEGTHLELYNYFNNKGLEIRIIFMNRNDYIKNKIQRESDLRRYFEIDFNKNNFDSVYQLLYSIVTSNPKYEEFYNCITFAAKFINLTQSHIRWNKENLSNFFDNFNNIPKPILNELKEYWCNKQSIAIV